MPYPNEHAARVKDPAKFQKDSFKRKSISAGVNIIIGKLDGETTMTTQAYRFDKNKFTVSEAKKWLKDNNVDYMSFEPASEKKEFQASLHETVKDIFSAGIWKGEEYTEEDLDEMINNFKRFSNFRVPLKIDFFKNTKTVRHGGQPAVGWIKDLKRVGAKLYAHIVDIPKSIKELIENRAYRNVSSEIIHNFSNGGDFFGKILSGVALLGVEHPGVENLDEFAKIYQSEFDFSNSDVRSYVVDENLEFQSKQEVKKMSEQVIAVNDVEVKNLKAEKEQLESQLKQFQSKFDELETSKVKGDEELNKIKAEKKATEIKHFVSAMETAGKILPAHKENVCAILENLEDTNMVKFSKDGETKEVSIVKMFQNFVESLPQLVNFDEKSKQGEIKTEKFAAKDETEEGSKEGQILDQKIKKYMSENKGVSYEEAYDKVS
jgi:hypothetical protein